MSQLNSQMVIIFKFKLKSFAFELFINKYILKKKTLFKKVYFFNKKKKEKFIVNNSTYIFIENLE